MILTQYVGNQVSHLIQMRWERQPFSPTGNYNLIWTLKSSPDSEDDTAAKIQKTLNAGITVSSSIATVTLLNVDTAGDAEADPIILPVDPGTYYWDIQYQDLDSPSDVRTVAFGQLILSRSVTRLTSASIPIYSETPISLTSFVSHSAAQTLTSAKKEQFWANLGIAAYNDLTSANTDLAAGVPYYDRALERLHITTA